MVWTVFTRAQYDRPEGRYSSDCTAGEWALIEPFLPARKRTGRPRTTDLRDVWDAIQYMAATGCQSLPGKRCKASLRGGDVPD